MCFRFLYIEDILWKYTQNILGSICLSHNNYTLIVGKVVCLVIMVVLLVGFLGGSVMKVDLSGAAKKKMGDLRFWIESDACRASYCFRSL